jgi:hypothetical protein
VNSLLTHQHPSLARNARRRGLFALQPVPHLLPCSKCETEGTVCPSTSPSSPPLLEMRDGGDCLPSNQSLIPSLARNARRRGLFALQPVPHPLPHLKRKTEGFSCPPTVRGLLVPLFSPNLAARSFRHLPRIRRSSGWLPTLPLLVKPFRFSSSASTLRCASARLPLFSATAPLPLSLPLPAR